MFKSLILFLCLFLINFSVAQEFAALNEELKNTIADENLTGAVWSTISDDIVTTGAIGIKNSDTKEILDDNDRVLICSITKL